MIKWTFCKTDYPEYEDLLDLARIINYHKRRIMAIKISPLANGYEDDPFVIQEAVYTHISQIEGFSDEYRYMVMMYWNEGRMVR